MEPILNEFFVDAYHNYNIANDKQGKKTKLRKSIVALAVASSISLAGSASAYVEPGQIGNKTSWETAEYQKDWGLAAMKASSAYALGFHGQGVKVGVMDSGALLFTHPDLDGSRFHAVQQTGQYGSSGMRYPQLIPGKQGEYTQGENFDISGEFVLGTNDSHGTHVTGTVGANRDGSEMHGVSWGSDIYVANNGGTDDNNYGPFQDYNFFYTGWKALVDSGAQVINNSWGTNIRIVNRGTTGPDGGNTGVHIPADGITQSEYEYFYFKKMYGNNPSFVDAAYDAVKGTSVVQIFTTGNRDFSNPFYRALFPYFNPEAEQHWIAVAGLQQDTVTPGNYTLEAKWNEAGDAKWWTVAAPGRNIYSTKVDVNTGVPYYDYSSGTSMSAPHVAGAMGVLLSRYQDMTAIQARDVLFTTANRYNPDGTPLPGWTAADGEADVRYGWGIPDLDKGMYGIGQFLGKFEYNMANTPLDVWSNDITQQALDAREVEDRAWLADFQLNGVNAGGGYELGHGFDVEDGNSDYTDHHIDPADAAAWRLAYYEKRAAAIQNKIDNGLYDGSLVKLGAGTLVMTGDNTYRGGTTVEGGDLYGFTESFGTEKVVVNGGRFGVINSYNDTFTLKGTLTSTGVRLADIDVNAGGTYVVSAEEAVNVGQLTFADGSQIAVGSTNAAILDNVYQNGATTTGTVTATTLTDADKAIVSPDYAFFTTDVGIAGNTITATLSRNNSVNFATYSMTHNGNVIANTVEGTGSGDVYNELLTSTADQVRSTYNSLGSDMHLNAQNASIVNSMTMSRAVKDQAVGAGHGRFVEMVEGSGRLWTAAIGNWSTVDYGHSDMDVDFYAALVGAEVDVAESTKVGVYFGAGETKFKGGIHGKIDSDDLHVGLYGVSNFDNMAQLTYGVMHTNQDRDSKRTLVVGSQAEMNSVSNDVEITQLFVEAAYTGLDTGTIAVEPYLGFGWMHVKADDYVERVGTMEFKTSTDNQDLQIATLGVRGAIPFNAGSVKMAVKGDVYGMQFFGDKRAKADMRLGTSGTAKLRGGELSNMVGVGVGVEAKLAKSVTLGVSYNGAYDSDVKSNGVYAKLNIGF